DPSLLDIPEVSQLRVREPEPLGSAPTRTVDALEADGLEIPSFFGDRRQLIEVPGVDPGGLEDAVAIDPPADGRLELEGPIGRGDRRRLDERLVLEGVETRFGGISVEAEPTLLQRAQRLLKRLGERPADRHGLADRLHLRAED